jgi:hypothetical protein
MLYAFLAYHDEAAIDALTEAQDDALMEDLHTVHHRLIASGNLGPAARLGPTRSARTLRGSAVMDGPFAETKEQLLGFYVMDFPSLDEASNHPLPAWSDGRPKLTRHDLSELAAGLTGVLLHAPHRLAAALVHQH